MLKDASEKKFFIFNVKDLFFNKIKCDKKYEYFNTCFFE